MLICLWLVSYCLFVWKVRGFWRIFIIFCYNVSCGINFIYHALAEACLIWNCSILTYVCDCFVFVSTVVFLFSIEYLNYCVSSVSGDIDGYCFNYTLSSIGKSVWKNNYIFWFWEDSYPLWWVFEILLFLSFSLYVISHYFIWVVLYLLFRWQL